MVGGKVYHVFRIGNRVCLVVRGTGTESSDLRAVEIDRSDLDATLIQVGDEVWWQSSWLLWTPADRSRQDISISLVRRAYDAELLFAEVRARARRGICPVCEKTNCMHDGDGSIWCPDCGASYILRDDRSAEDKSDVVDDQLDPKVVQVEEGDEGNVLLGLMYKALNELSALMEKSGMDSKMLPPSIAIVDMYANALQAHALSGISTAMNSKETIEKIAVEVVEWQGKQFPHSNPAGFAAHLLDEANELVEEPTSAEEMADILMLLVGLASICGVDLAAELRRKLEINKARKWGDADERGVVSHVREGDA